MSSLTGDTDGGPVHVVLAADRSYARQLAVAIVGISEVAGGRRHVVHVLHDGAQRRALEPVTACAGDAVDLRWLDVRSSPPQHDLSGVLSHPRFYRLRAERLLPEGLDRVLYLDVDVVLRGRLDALWDVELGEALAGGVRDAYQWSIGISLPWRELGLNPALPYFNSGVLCIQLDRWRSEEIGAQAEALVAQGVVPASDQDALNVVLAGRTRMLDPRWNLQSHHLAGDVSPAWACEGASVLAAALADPAVVHFCGGTFNRPWDEPCGHPYRDDWLEHLDRTPWSGWRPRREPVVRRALRRARRAGRTLIRGG